MSVYLLLSYCNIDIICMYTEETEIKIYIYTLAIMTPARPTRICKSKVVLTMGTLR